jgi:hypothetical protein
MRKLGKNLCEKLSQCKNWFGAFWEEIALVLGKL